MGRREQIVDAARALIDEQDPRPLSVRTIAARSGLGASTLRHYFPTQRDLHAAVLATYVDETIDDLRINDEAITPRDRLIECLVQFIPPTVDAKSWRLAIGAFFGEGAAPGADQAWGLLGERYRDKVRSWLGVLSAEGVVHGDVDRRARFLTAVVDGVAIGRLSGDAGLGLVEERQVLEDAVDAVLV